MNRFKAILTVVCIVASAAFTASATPGTYPFPWAKDCPMNWGNLAGRYEFAECGCELIEVRISGMTRTGRRTVTVERYSESGQVAALGKTTMSVDQNYIKVLLRPRSRSGQAMWAMIRLHYQSANQMCGDDNLVPVLTLMSLDSREKTEYLLQKID